LDPVISGCFGVSLANNWRTSSQSEKQAFSAQVPNVSRSVRVNRKAAKQHPAAAGAVMIPIARLPKPLKKRSKKQKR
jgi:hypothetical protein